MKLLAIPLAILAIVLGLRLSGPVVENWEDRNAHQRSMQFYEEQQREFDLQQYQARQSATLPGKIASDYGLVILLFVGAGGLLYYLRDAYQVRRQPLTRYDPAHPLVARRLIEQADPMLLEAMIAALQLNGQAQIARAHASANVPTNYAPHISMSQPPRPAAIEPPAQIISAPSTAATLPDEAPLAAVRSATKPGHIVYGMLPGNEPLVLPFGRAYHGLGAGDTRTGKSNWLDSIIAQLHDQAQHYPIALTIGDFNREMDSTGGRSSLPSAIETDPATIADMLADLVNGADGITQRYTHFKRIGEKQGRVIRNLADYARVTGQRQRISFVVLDEINALIEACEAKDDLASALKIVLQMGAGAGVYVLGGAQYLTAKVFGRDGSKQFTTRALFGAFDQTAAGMIFGQGKLAPDARQLLTGIPGRGLIRTAGMGSPTPFQALHCDEADILDSIARYHASRGQLSDKQPTMDGSASEVGISAVSGFTRAPETSENPYANQARAEVSADDTFSTSDALQPSTATTYMAPAGLDLEKTIGVKVLLARGDSKTAIIKALWGASGGQPWLQASQEYERIKAHLNSEAA